MTGGDPQGKKKFLVLGATGATGRILTSQILDHGHEVRALVRNPAAVDTRPGLTFATGDARSPNDLAEAMAGMDLTVSALGLGQ